MSETQAETPMVPLCVKLEGTLTRTDLVWEMAIAELRKRPWILLLLPLLFLLGKRRLTGMLAGRVAIDATTLPYTKELLEYLSQKSGDGQPIILVTAVPWAHAQAVAEHLGIFTDVLSFSGRAEVEEREQALIERYGVGGFDYAGSRISEARLWKTARIPIIVNASPGLVGKIGTTRNPAILLAPRTLSVRAILSTIRLDQWVKNVLVFVPVLAAHKMDSAPALATAALAFVAFSCAASSNYIFNDLFDLTSDRLHPRKRHRPLAAAVLSVPCSLATASLLLLASLLPASFLPADFLAWLVLYLIVAWTYTVLLKRYVLLDVVALACLYTLRVVAGGAATGIRLSFWLLTFCLFIFASLALVKRCSELISAPSTRAIETNGRDYNLTDVSYLSAMGIASGYMAVLLIALYVNSPDTAALYSRPMVLWLLCPLTLFWISRMWILVGRGHIEDDPIAFALHDKGGLLVVFASCLTLLAAL